MREYFEILLISGIFGSIASVLSDGSSLGKYVKYISALVSVIIVISPLSSVIKGITVPVSTWEENTVSSGQLTAFAAQMTEEQISQKIAEKFGIIPEGISIEIDRDENITVSFSLKDEDMKLYDDVERFINSLYDEK